MQEEGELSKLVVSINTQAVVDRISWIESRHIGAD